MKERAVLGAAALLLALACATNEPANRVRVRPYSLSEATHASLEEEPELLLRLAHPLREDVGALAHEEGHRPARRRARVGERARDERLARAGRPMEEHATGRGHAERVEDLRVD